MSMCTRPRESAYYVQRSSVRCRVIVSTWTFSGDACAHIHTPLCFHNTNRTLQTDKEQCDNQPRWRMNAVQRNDWIFMNWLTPSTAPNANMSYLVKHTSKCVAETWHQFKLSKMRGKDPPLINHFGLKHGSPTIGPSTGKKLHIGLHRGAEQVPIYILFLYSIFFLTGGEFHSVRTQNILLIIRWRKTFDFEHRVYPCFCQNAHRDHVKN